MRDDVICENDMCMCIYNKYVCISKSRDEFNRTVKSGGK